MKQEYIFYPAPEKECEVCGIVSFAHKHPPNTLPKDFEIIEEESR